VPESPSGGGLWPDVHPGDNSGIREARRSPYGIEGWHADHRGHQTSVFLGTKLARRADGEDAADDSSISSIIGFCRSTSGHHAYHASKGAVRIYSKAAAVRLAPHS